MSALSLHHTSRLLMGLFLIFVNNFFSLFFEGLDDDGDPKGNYAFLLLLYEFCLLVTSGGNNSHTECCALGLLGSDATLLQRNGDIATAETQTTMINGYTCSDCSMLSERKEVLTAYSASSVPSSRIYSRDRSQKHASSK